jgi:hypothetical protein
VTARKLALTLTLLLLGGADVEAKKGARRAVAPKAQQAIAAVRAAAQARGGLLHS